MNWFGGSNRNGQVLLYFNLLTLGFYLEPMVWNFGKVEVVHVCLVYGLQIELKGQRRLHKKSLKLFG